MNDDATSRSAFSAPGFLVAAGAVAGLVVLTLVMILGGPDDPPEADAGPGTPPTAPPAQPRTETAVVDDDESVCGLEGTDDERLTSAPDVDTWDFQGTVPYPVSETHGPGATTDRGIRYCFAHSPEGALFAAANALAQASDPAAAQDWARTFLSDGPARDRWIADAADTTDEDGVRFSVAGFRLLAYTGSTARVDLGVAGSVSGSAVHGTFVYELVWRDGDWRLDATAPRPLDYATVPDLAGYITWGAAP